MNDDREICVGPGISGPHKCEWCGYAYHSSVEGHSCKDKRAKSFGRILSDDESARLEWALYADPGDLVGYMCAEPSCGELNPLFRGDKKCSRCGKLSLGFKSHALHLPAPPTVQEKGE